MLAELVVDSNSNSSSPVIALPSIGLRGLGKFTVLSHVYVRSQRATKSR
jgi:hypothetical protein